MIFLVNASFQFGRVDIYDKLLSADAMWIKIVFNNFVHMQTLQRNSLDADEDVT